jgi:ketosteroid isomerase-like protein
MHRPEHLSAGDPPPQAVAELYARAADGDVEAAVAQFAADAIYAFGADEHDERGARVVATGRDEIARALRVDLAAGAGRLLVCLRQEGNCLVEGRLDDGFGTHVATFAASFQLHGDGSMRRAVTYRTTPVPPATSWLDPPTTDAADARRALERYFLRLEAGDFEGAVECFSDQVLYAYPQDEPGRARPIRVGRRRLLEAFVERGPRPWRHRVLTAVQRGRNCLVEGDVLGLPAERSGGWIAGLTLDGEGLIERYCAFYAEPAAPRPELDSAVAVRGT